MYFPDGIEILCYRNKYRCKFSYFSIAIMDLNKLVRLQYEKFKLQLLILIISKKTYQLIVPIFKHKNQLQFLWALYDT